MAKLNFLLSPYRFFISFDFLPVISMSILYPTVFNLRLTHQLSLSVLVLFQLMIQTVPILLFLLPILLNFHHFHILLLLVCKIFKQLPKMLPFCFLFESDKHFAFVVYSNVARMLWLWYSVLEKVLEIVFALLESFEAHCFLLHVEDAT